MLPMVMSEHETVRIEVPADVRFVRVVRQCVSALASSAGFRLDELDDLNLAVSEVMAVLISASTGATIKIAFSGVGVQLRVEASCEGTLGPPGLTDTDQLREQIMSVVADDHGTSESSGRLSIWFERSAEPVEG
jgi:anti-sigma regulatory factor (Ser/Thr protein kinase)